MAERGTATMLCLPGPENWEAFKDSRLHVAGHDIAVHQEGGQVRISTGKDEFRCIHSS
jgi:hypothetical protein